MNHKSFRSVQILALCCILALFLSGCGQGATNAGAPAALSLEEDIGISVNGSWYPIREDAAPLLAALGENPQITSYPSCVFEGEDREFLYPHCMVFTNPNGETDIWYNICLTSDTLSTARGIRVGRTLEEVQKVYGETFYWEGESILTYSVSGVEGDYKSPCILFTIVENVVEEIEIYYPTNVI